MLDMINFELAHGNFPQVVALYEKALRGLGGSVGAVPGVDIWRESAPCIHRALRPVRLKWLWSSLCTRSYRLVPTLHP